MSASPQARVNRRVLILSVAVAGAAAVAYRAAMPSQSAQGSGAASASAKPAPSSARVESPEVVRLKEDTSTGSRLPALEIPERGELPREFLQPYPSQPADPPADAPLPQHPVRSYTVTEAQRFLELTVLAPEPVGEGWYIELSYEGGLIWQHAGDVADQRGLLTLKIPAQRLKTGHYQLFVRRQLEPKARNFLYRFDVEIE
ncbi:MAG: hypothetical protein KC766_37900 [Myxococcales bacterium]|nr:hypothetical protein [Myxococcales bacterium]